MTVAENFRDYWYGIAGAKGRKADWPATWRTWVRKENGKRSTTGSAFAGSRTAMQAEAKPAWALNAGFTTRFEAENEGCTERNAKSFRHGKLVRVEERTAGSEARA